MKMDGSAFNGLGSALVLLFWTAFAGVIGCVILVVYVITMWVTEPDWQREAISRGFASYCPENGEFAWKGECSQ